MLGWKVNLKNIPKNAFYHFILISEFWALSSSNIWGTCCKTDDDPYISSHKK
jgi:hypothetical protein